MTPESEALLALDVDELIREARRPAMPSREVLAAARRRNRALAYRYLQTAARRGVRTPDDSASEALLASFRRDALREAGVDERLVRGAA